MVHLWKIQSLEFSVTAQNELFMFCVMLKFPVAGLQRKNSCVRARSPLQRTKLSLISCEFWKMLAKPSLTTPPPPPRAMLDQPF